MAARVWLITGASRGLGRVLTETVLEAGHCVAVITRDSSRLAKLENRFGPQLRVHQVDLSNVSDVRSVVADSVRAFGGVDVVVNNAAKVVFAPAEDQSEQDLRGQMEVSFFGAVHVTQAAIPIFREQRSGRLIQISSMNTRRAVAGVAGYSAAKWALSGYSYSLSEELAPFGVKVTLVEPGGLRTRMVQDAEPRSIRSDYAATVGREAARFLKRVGNEPIDPARAAQVILDLAQADDPPLRLVLGADAVALAQLLNDRQRASDDAWAALGRAADFR